MRRVLFILGVVIFISLGLWFGHLNSAKVTFHYFFGELENISLAVIALSGVLLGVIVGFSVAYFSFVIKLQYQVRRLSKQLHTDLSVTDITPNE